MSMVYGLYDNFDTNNNPSIPLLTRKMKTVIRKGEIIRYLAWLDHRDQEWEKQHGKWYMKNQHHVQHHVQQQQQQQQKPPYYMNVRAVPPNNENINTGFDMCRFDYSSYEEKQRLFYCWVFFVVSIAIILIILVYRISIYHGYGSTTIPYHKPTTTTTTERGGISSET